MHITKWKKPIWKATNCMIPNLWHSGKDTVMVTMKRSVTDKGAGEERDG